MKYLLIQLFLVIQISISAQFTVSGTITGEGEPLMGAYVYPQNDPGRVQITDSVGYFKLEMEAVDSLIVSYLGFDTYKLYVDQSQAGISVSLQSSKAMNSPTATVKAKRIRAGELAAQRITQLDIYLDPAAKADPLLAVNNLPSATNLDETANVSLRGSPSVATGVYLDGVPIRSAVRLDQSNGLGQFSIFGQFPLEEVRVYPGHPPIALGRSSAGAVQLRTANDPLKGPSYGISVNLAGMGLSHARPIGKKTDLRTFVNWSQLTAFQALNDGTFSDLRGSAGLDGAIALTHRFNDRSRVNAYVLAFEENYRFLTRTNYLTDEFKQTKSRQLGVFSYQHEGESWKWRVSQMLDWDRSEFTFGNINSQPDRFNMYSEVSARQEGRGYSRAFGLQYDRFSDQVSGTFPLTDYEFAANDPFDSFTAGIVQSIITAFSSTEQRLTGYLIMEAGVRMVYDPQSRDTRFSAQGSLHYRPNVRHRVILGGGHYQQLLSPGPGISQWQWLQLDQLSLSYQMRQDLWSFDAAVFRKWENYQLSTDQNISGIETRIGYSDNGYRAWLSGGIVRVNDRENSIPSAQDLPFLIRGQIVRASRDGFSFGLTGTWREGRYFLPLLRSEPIPESEGLYRPIFASPSEGTRLHEYIRVDLSISKMLTLGRGQLILYANVNNLFNIQNVNRYIYPNGTDPRKSELYSGRILFVGGVWTIASS
ncbi:MAG: hypothetical protein AAF741_17280 [Bacteroidota bacterium]